MTVNNDLKRKADTSADEDAHKKTKSLEVENARIMFQSQYKDLRITDEDVDNNEIDEIRNKLLAASEIITQMKNVIYL